jgi:hypothetical protein
METHSIDLPKTQGLGDFGRAFFGVEFDSNFQTGNDNHPGEIGVISHGVEAAQAGAEGDSSLLYSSAPVKTPKLGRPKTRPWYEQRENGRLRKGRKAITKVIADKVIMAMLDGAQHAGVIEATLNTFVTIKPANIDTVPPEDRSTFWQDELNRVQAFLRRNEVVPTYIWSRESRVGDGMGEHLHLLLSLPKRLIDTLRGCLMDRYQQHGEVDVRPASEIAKRAENGKLMSAVTYVTKAMSQRARRKSNQPYRPSGPVMGKRAGMTRNIDAKAVAAFRVATDQMTQRSA